MGLDHGEVLEHAQAPLDGLAQPDPALPGNLPVHGGLGSGGSGRPALGLAGDGHRAAGADGAFLDGVPGALAAGAQPLATSAATWDPPSPPVETPPIDPRLARARWYGFALGCLVLMALTVAGLCRTYLEYHSLTGQARPHPLAVRAGRLELRVYGWRAAIPLPRHAWPRTLRSLGRHGRATVRRLVDALFDPWIP